jgi:RNA polymerase sigma factor (sigma-70 family)
MSEPFSWDERASIDDVYRSLFPALSRHCRRVLGGDRATACDAAQETFARVIAHRPPLATVADVRRYLFRAATNLCINLLRQGRRASLEAGGSDHDAHRDEVLGGDESSRDAALTSALTVARVLDDSSARDRAIFVWHYLGGASQSDIASYLGVTRRTVYSRLRVLQRAARGGLCC